MSDRFRSAVAGLTALALVGLPAPYAFAQGTSTQAEILFRQAQEIMKKPGAGTDEIHAACLKYKDSYKLDAALNTLVALAACHEKEGKTATAWGEYTDAASQGGPAATYAKERAAALEKAGFAKLVVQLSPVPNGTAATLDGEPFANSAMNSETPADPGEHELTVTSPGKKTFAAKFTLTKGGAPLKVPVALVDAPPDQPPGPVTPVIVEKQVPAETGWTTMRTTGFIVGVAGVATLLVAAGVQVYALISAANRDNLVIDMAPQDVIDAQDQKAQASQSAAIALLVAGGVVTITGAVMFIVGARKDPEPAKAGVRFLPAFGPGYAGAGLSGRF